jgi:hypothetical protein
VRKSITQLLAKPLRGGRSRDSGQDRRAPARDTVSIGRLRAAALDVTIDETARSASLFATPLAERGSWRVVMWGRDRTGAASAGR